MALCYESLGLILLLAPSITAFYDYDYDYDYDLDVITNQLRDRIDDNVHPDAYLSATEIIEKYEYPLEVHRVQTQDDYVLEMHRIPHNKNTTKPNPHRPVILLMHGLLCSSADWVMTGVDKGLAFILSDLGYDVWMGNARGNTWSKKHNFLDPDQNSKFWEFSWNEIGIYDLPAKIDHILKVTKQKKIFYAGHSQGTTSFFVMASERPEYNKKIRMMSALAPIAYMGGMPNLFFKFISQFHGPLGSLLNMLGVNEFMPNHYLLNLLSQTACQEKSIVKGICSNVLFLIAGFDSNQLNNTVLPIILSHTPAGASTRQLLHYGQGVSSKKFRKYDFGNENIIKYNSEEPPEYNIKKMTARIATFYGPNDILAAEQDVERFTKQLPHLVINYKVPFAKFNHLDFLWGNDVRTLVYDKMIQLMSKH